MDILAIFPQNPSVRAHGRCLSPSGHLDCIYEGGILLQK